MRQIKKTLKKYVFLVVLLSFVFSGFLGFAQDDDDSLEALLGFQEEEITCDSIAEMFQEYNDMVKLLQASFAKSLTEVSNTLGGMIETKSITISALERKQTEVEEARDIVNQNRSKISNSGENILSVLQDCLNK